MTVTVNSAANPARRYSVTPRTPPPDGGNNDQDQLLDHYLACWNETGADARRALIGRYWSADSSYVDPLTQIQGRDALAATIAAVQSQFPGFVFSPAGPLDTHHNVARFTWGLGPEGAEPVAVGFDGPVGPRSGASEADDGDPGRRDRRAHMVRHRHSGLGAFGEAVAMLPAATTFTHQRRGDVVRWLRSWPAR
jgi:hypothetical protein